MLVYNEDKKNMLRMEEGKLSSEIMQRTAQHNDDRKKLMNLWAMIRWFMLIVLFSIGLIHLSHAQINDGKLVFYGGFFGVFILNVLFQFQTRYTRTWVVIFQIVLDIIFATYVVHFTGGLSSSLVWIYLLGIVTASLMIPQTGGFIAGLIGSMALLFLILLYQYGVITPLNAAADETGEMIIYILSYTGLFCGVSMIANYLSDQMYLKMKQESTIEAEETEIIQLREELQAAREDMNTLSELMPVLKDISHLDHDLNTPLCIISLSLSRVKRLGIELDDEGLQKTGNEITEAINKINMILMRLDALKNHPFVKKERGH
ncbi:MAG: histidine kinase [Candidatus Cloacimonetes bacterium]|nr:histidine kinase [Candidatus Cloacimonadota bacterium]